MTLTHHLINFRKNDLPNRNLIHQSKLLRFLQMKHADVHPRARFRKHRDTSLICCLASLIFFILRRDHSLADAPITMVNQAHSHVGLTNLTQSSNPNTNPSIDPSTDSSTDSSNDSKTNPCLNPCNNPAIQLGGSKSTLRPSVCPPSRHHTKPGGSQDQR